MATVEILLHQWQKGKDNVSDLKAATYNLENGKVVVTKLDKSAFVTIKDGDDQIIRFTFPNLQEGSIIEYAYKKTIPIAEYLPSWAFQGRYPRLESKFETEVPDFLEFVTINQGYLKATDENVSYSEDNFFIVDQNAVSHAGSEIYSMRSTTVKHTWLYKNVPGLKTEEYISQLGNYVQKVSFQYSVLHFEGVTPKYFLHSWPDAAAQLMKDKDFGADLYKNNSWLKDEIAASIKGEKDSLLMAEKLFKSVRDHYKCTNDKTYLLSQSLKKTAESKSGNVADINLLLVAMLRNIGLDANPLLLSTRTHGRAFDQYPIMDKFNYVVAALEMDDNIYLLDASDPDLGFNKLNPECYNGNGRVITTKPFLVSLSPNLLNESTVSSVFIMNGEKGKMSGTSSTLMGDIESTNMRIKMKKESAENYFKDLQKSFSMEMNLDNTHIDSLRMP